MKANGHHLVDQLLVMNAQDGDARAFDTLVKRWQKRLWAYARRLTHNDDAAWDVTQEAWLAAINGLRKLNDPAAFRPWIYRIVMHKAANWIDQRQRSRQRNRTLADHEATTNPSSSQSMDMHQTVNNLPSDQRRVIELYYFEQLAVGEIAMVLDIPAGTVKSRLHHARDALRNLWEANAS